MNEPQNNPYAPPRADSSPQREPAAGVSTPSRWMAWIDLALNTLFAACALWLIAMVLIIFGPPLDPPPAGQQNTVDHGVVRAQVLTTTGIAAIYFALVVLLGYLGNLPRAKGRPKGAFWLMFRFLFVVPMYPFFINAIINDYKADLWLFIVLLVFSTVILFWIVQFIFIHNDRRTLAAR